MSENKTNLMACHTVCIHISHSRNMVIVPRRDITRVLATVLRPGCFESRKISLHNIGL